MFLFDVHYWSVPSEEKGLDGPGQNGKEFGVEGEDLYGDLSGHFLSTSTSPLSRALLDCVIATTYKATSLLIVTNGPHNPAESRLSMFMVCSWCFWNMFSHIVLPCCCEPLIQFWVI